MNEQKQFFDSSEPPESSKRNGYKNYFGVEKPKFSGGRSVLDYYHFKTYFKTIESLALDLHTSVRNISRAEIQQKRKNENLGMNDVFEKKTEEIGLCKEDTIPMGNEVMEKYGIWQCKKPFTALMNKRRHQTPK